VINWFDVAEGERVGHGVEQVRAAVVERADDQAGHGFLRDAWDGRRSRPDQRIRGIQT
jgi:hypothetical protein